MKKAFLLKPFKEWIASWNWHRTKQINDLFMIITIQLIISRRTKVAVASFQKCSKNYLYMHCINSIYNNWIIFMINNPKKKIMISTIYRYLTMIHFTDNSPYFIHYGNQMHWLLSLEFLRRWQVSSRVYLSLCVNINYIS